MLFPQIYLLSWRGSGGGLVSCLVAKQAVEFPQVLASIIISLHRHCVSCSHLNLRNLIPHSGSISISAFFHLGLGATASRCLVFLKLYMQAFLMDRSISFVLGAI